MPAKWVKTHLFRYSNKKKRERTIADKINFPKKKRKKAFILSFQRLSFWYLQTLLQLTRANILVNGS